MTEMNQEKSAPKQSAGAIEKRRTVMADGRRYLIYYTFETNKNAETKSLDEQNKVETNENA